MKHISVWKLFILILSVIILLGACGDVVSDDRDPTKSYLLVKNFSSKSIFAVYCTDSSSATWGDDLLGNELLVSGSEKEIAVEPGMKDIRVDIQTTYGENNGAYEVYEVLFEANNTIELPLYDPES
jgi:hypothetical protein